MKKVKLLVSAFIVAIALSSCYTLEHTVGTGAQGNNVQEKKQWYALWGAVPINKVDSKAMAGDSENYSITTKHKFVDYVISYFTSAVSITVQTVEVQK